MTKQPDSQTSTDEIGHPYVEPGPTGKARFRPGNPGRPKGTKNRSTKTKRITVAEKRVLAETAFEKISAAVDPNLRAIIDKLSEKALNGDTSAAGLLLRHVAAPVSTTVLRNVDDLEYMLPERRIAEVNRRLLAGKVSVETAEAVVNAAQAELQSALVTPLRTLLGEFRRTRDISAFVEELSRLPIGLTIENEPNPS